MGGQLHWAPDSHGSRKSQPSVVKLISCKFSFGICHLILNLIHRWCHSLYILWQSIALILMYLPCNVTYPYLTDCFDTHKCSYICVCVCVFSLWSTLSGMDITKHWSKHLEVFCWCRLRCLTTNRSPENLSSHLFRVLICSRCCANKA